MARLACIVLCAAALASCKAFRAPAVPEHPTAPPAMTLGVVRIGPPSSPGDGEVTTRDRGEFLFRLQEDLKATGLFERVVMDTTVPADVVVVAEYAPRSCYAEPVVTVATLGLVPYPDCYYSGYRLTMSGAELPNGHVVVDNRSRPVVLIGWVSGPLSLFPGWESSLPRAQEAEALRAAILLAILPGEEATEDPPR